MRPASTVMDLDRLGRLHPYRLSFMRILLRKIAREGWTITRERFDLDDDGFGDTIYKITTPNNIFRLVVFSHFLDDQNRSDRVIAEAWDVTMTLCTGEVDDARLDTLRANVPLQEKGRVDADCLVLSRANRSARNFAYVVGKLASGEQPDLEVMAKVGYLCRTTAVYGSGKFGMADWQKLQTECPDFASPFMAEMLVCYLIRQFSLDQAEHIARRKNPEGFVKMSNQVKNYVGIGNATGLGMAPYLINHPQLIARWVEKREIAIARVKAHGVFDSAQKSGLHARCRRVLQHLSEIDTDNEEQNEINRKTRSEIEQLLNDLNQGASAIEGWTALTAYIAEQFSPETEELINCLMVEAYPDLVGDLEDYLRFEEGFALDPLMALAEFCALLESHYDWALAHDYSDQTAQGVFWYRSEEKMEPRLGQRFDEPGADKEMRLGIGWYAQACYHDASSFLQGRPDAPLAEFIIAHPEHRYIARRIQTMSRTRYGEIRANLIHSDVLPIHLLRCKLSFFGVSKFDPRSRLWVRNTMFQGAPDCEQLMQGFSDDWAFPVKPDKAA